MDAMRLIFPLLFYASVWRTALACSSSFTNLDVDVSVDHSTNIGAVIYTLMNGNDARGIEMDTSTSGSYGLNPANDHEVIVTACVFWIGNELLQFKISGDSYSCGSLNFIPSPAIPQFTNPTEIVKIGAIGFMETVDVVQITLANDQCADFDCSSVSCTNDPSQNFAFFDGPQMIRISNVNLQYGVTYTVEVTCTDTKLSAGTGTQTLTIVFYETAPTSTMISTTTTTTPSTTTTMPSTTTTTPSTTTTTPTTTTTTLTISTTTPSTTTTKPSTSMTTSSTSTTTLSTSTTTPSTTTTTPSTSTTTPSTSTTTPSTTTATSSTITTTPSTITTTPTTTTTTPSTTTTTPTTSMTTPTTSTTTSSTSITTPSTITTTPSTTTTTSTTSTITPTATTTTPSTTTTTIQPTTASASLSSTDPTSITTVTHTATSTYSSSSQRGSANALAAGIDVSDPEVTNIAAIAAGASIGGVGLLGLIAFSLYKKFATTETISPRSGWSTEDGNNDDVESGGSSTDRSTASLIDGSGDSHRPPLVPVEINELGFI